MKRSVTPGKDLEVSCTYIHFHGKASDDDRLVINYELVKLLSIRLAIGYRVIILFHHMI